MAKTFSQYIKALLEHESDEKKSPNGLILSVFFSNSATSIVKVLEAQDDYMLVQDENGSVFAIPYASAIGKVANVTHSTTHQWKGKP